MTLGTENMSNARNNVVLVLALLVGKAFSLSIGEGRVMAITDTQS